MEQICNAPGPGPEGTKKTITFGPGIDSLTESLANEIPYTFGFADGSWLTGTVELIRRIGRGMYYINVVAQDDGKTHVGEYRPYNPSSDIAGYLEESTPSAAAATCSTHSATEAGENVGGATTAPSGMGPTFPDEEGDIPVRPSFPSFLSFL